MNDSPKVNGPNGLKDPAFLAIRKRMFKCPYWNYRPIGHSARVAKARRRWYARNVGLKRWLIKYGLYKRGKR